MNVRSNASRLTGITKELLVQWSETEYHWKDKKSAEFARRYMDELQMAVDRTVTVIEELDKILVKVRKDCE